MKLTKQGVRDLGNNATRPRHACKRSHDGQHLRGPTIVIEPGVHVCSCAWCGEVMP